MKSVRATILLLCLLAPATWAEPADNSGAPIEAEPVKTIGQDGGRAISPGRDGNGSKGFCFDFAEGVNVKSSGQMVEAGAVVLDFETERSWPEAAAKLPPKGNLLSSAARDPFRPRGATPVTDIVVGSHQLTLAPATLDAKASDLSLTGMVTRLPVEETGIYPVRDEVSGDTEPVTLSGIQGLIAAPASHNDRSVGMMITFDQPVFAAGIGAFNRSTAHGGDNNLEVAAFDEAGSLLARYRLPGGKTIDAGGKGTPMYVGLEAPAKRAIKHLFVGHLHASSRNLVFDDLAFTPAP